jgi:N-acetyl-anhydromuramyl-L-alanine amidase AmpD
LGIQGSGGRHDRRSIGIEIANVGPLKKAGNRLNWWPKDFGTEYAGEHVALKSPYRGFNHYAAFPEAQVAAVAGLVHDICERFGIPKTLAGSNRRLEFDPTFFNTYSGVATHANFRKDKYDIGPAFDWDRLGL